VKGEKWASGVISLLTSRFSLYSPVLQSMIPRFFTPLVFTGLLSLFLNGCASSGQSGGSPRDYSVAVGAAYTNEEHIAQDRVNKYLARLKPEKKEQIAQNGYLAVDAVEVPVSEVPGLAGKIPGQTGGLTDRASQMTKFIMIFDAKTGQPVSQEGYIAVETPPKGRLGVFGGYTALYIGNGK
jgi:hypothetical protein